MNDTVQLDLKFDPTALKDDLARLANSGWIDHFVKQNYEGQRSVIPLRGPADATHPVRMIYSDPSCIEFSDTPFLEHTPYLKQVLSSFNCSLQSVRLMKLSADSKIKEHRDHDLSLEEGIVRLHVPIVTNDQVDFRLNSKRVVMKEGECWYLRLSDPHSVQNNGQVDRIHLVIDAEVNDWLSSKLVVSENA